MDQRDGRTRAQWRDAIMAIIDGGATLESAAASLGVDPAVLRTRIHDLVSEDEPAAVAPPIDYRSMVESLNDVIFTLDNDGNMTYLSPAMERLSGYSLAELEGRSFLEFVHPDDLSALMVSYTQTMQGNIAPHEFRVFDKDGTIRHIRTSSRLLDADNPSKGVIGFLTDITSERRTADALRASESWLDVALRGGDLGLWDLDLHTSQMTVNDRWASMFGYSPDEMRPAETAWQERVHPDDIGWVANRVRRLALGEIDTFEAEYRFRRKDGSWAWVLSRARAVALDEAGVPTRVAGTHLDISQRRQSDLLLGAERRMLALMAHLEPLNEVLREAAKSVDALVDGARAIVLLAEADGVYTVGSAPSFSSEQVAAIDAFANTPGERPFCMAARTRDRQVSLDVSSDPKWNDAAAFASVTNAQGCWCQPIESSKGNVLGILLVVLKQGREPSPFEAEVLEAISVLSGIAVERNRYEEEHSRLEMQMLHTQKLESLGVLAGGIAHDFNNLLVSILGNADLTLAEMAPDAPRRRNLETVIASSQRAAELCNQMLAYSGKGLFSVQAIHMSLLVKEMAHLLHVSIPKTVQFHYACADDIPGVMGDPAQIRQVIMNLITNAADAIGKKEGVITLTTDVMECDAPYLAATVVDDKLPAGKYVFCEVVDTGSGMDSKTLARIFDPFFTTKFAGRGLGLAALLGIVRRHKAAVKVLSQPGKGTTIRVLFPAANIPAEAFVTKADDAAQQGHGRILFVDDEEQVRLVGKAVLEKAGYEIVCASDGIEAIQLFHQQADEFTAVILDMTMPRMSGSETYQKLRAISTDVPIILSSGYSEDDCLQQIGNEKIHGFIQKPYLAHELMQVVGQALAR